MAAPNQYNESETITKFEIMDGAPIRGETIPIRLFLGGFELTPTFRDVNKKFSTRYYLNLVLIDEENRRYFKWVFRFVSRLHFFPILYSNYLLRFLVDNHRQQEITVYRQDIRDDPIATEPLALGQKLEDSREQGIQGPIESMEGGVEEVSQVEQVVV